MAGSNWSLVATGIGFEWPKIKRFGQLKIKYSDHQSHWIAKSFGFKKQIRIGSIDFEVEPEMPAKMQEIESIDFAVKISHFIRVKTAGK